MTTLWSLDESEYCRQIVLDTILAGGNYDLRATSSDWYPCWHRQENPNQPLVLIYYRPVVSPADRKGCRDSDLWRIVMAGADDTVIFYEAKHDDVIRKYRCLPPVISLHEMIDIGFSYEL